MKPTRVLYVGGTKAGQWGEVTETVVYHTQPPKVNLGSLAVGNEGSLEIPLPEREMYTMDEVVIMGYRLRVMVCYEDQMSGKSRSTMLMEAILQRDVIEAMGVGRHG